MRLLLLRYKTLSALVFLSLLSYSTSSEAEAQQKAQEQNAPETQARKDSEKKDLAASEQLELSSLEEKLFNRDFTKDSVSERLARLEDFVFGAKTNAENEDRIEKLQKALKKNSSPSESAPALKTVSKAKTAASPGPRGVLSIINQGIDNYNRHRFHNAEDDFNQALELAPGMSRIYVYLGVTLLQINQRQSAIDAMKAAYELDPFGTYGRYAKHCLIVLMGDDAVRRRGPKDNLKVVKKTVDNVNSQAYADAARHSNIGQSIARAKQISASNFRVQQDPENYSNELALKQAFVRTDAMVQAAKARQEAAKRAADTRESANNLKALITAKHLPGDAKLRAFGTTLNTRYYGDETYNLAPHYIPREAPLELKASAKSIKAAPAKKQPVKKNSLKAKSTGRSYNNRSSVKRGNKR